VIINNEIKLGLTQSLNKGIKMSQGKYIARLDDDDFWCDKRKIEKQVDFLEKNKDFVLVGGGAVKMDSKGKDMEKYIFPEKDQDIRKRLLARNSFIHISVLYKKDAWEKVGGYDKEFDGLEDWDLWLKMGTIGKFYNIQDIFARYAGHQHKNPSYFDKTHNNKLKGLMLKLRLIKKYRKYYPGYIKAVLFRLLALVKI
jgi:glycosyltransferase involved in cell wall biosynthesis